MLQKCLQIFFYRNSIYIASSSDVSQAAVDDILKIIDETTDVSRDETVDNLLAVVTESDLRVDIASSSDISQAAVDESLMTIDETTDVSRDETGDNLLAVVTDSNFRPDIASGAEISQATLGESIICCQGNEMQSNLTSGVFTIIVQDHIEVGEPSVDTAIISVTAEEYNALLHFVHSNNSISNDIMENSFAKDATVEQHDVESGTGSNSLPYVSIVDTEAPNNNIAITDNNVREVMKQGKCRKRLRNEENWKRNKYRRLVNSGEEYVNKSGKVVKARRSNDVITRCCKSNCYEKITSEECTQLRDKFWKSSNYNAQCAYIAGCISQNPVKTRRIVSSSIGSTSGACCARQRRKNVKKNYSRKYGLKVSDRTTIVCQKYFCQLLSVSPGRINRILQGARGNGGVPCQDKRGTHIRSEGKLFTASVVDYIKQHILTFPVNESHYTRSHSDNRQYLAQDLTLAKMYHLYLEKCTEEGITAQKEWVYRFIFNTKFNLSFHPPRKDTCKRCDLYKAQVAVESSETRRVVEAEHEVHLRKAEMARKSLRDEKRKGENDNKYEAFTFDLEKVMSVPKLSTNEVYYCRQLNVYNLGVHSLISGKSSMYVWDESIASRGADEIGSCLIDYCQQLAAKGMKTLTCYSDSCGGQNRNSKIALIWMYIVQTTDIEEINHKFMISGHSYLPNDTEFGIIERATKKATEIYVPEQWYRLVSKCNKKTPFKVVQMTSEQFFSTKPLLDKSTVRKVAESGEKVEWLKIQWLRACKDSPQKLFYKYSLQDDYEFSCVNFAKRGRQDTVASLVPLYPEQPRPISSEKFNDIQKLLKYVPPIHHPFYAVLRGVSAVQLVQDECDEGSSDNENDAFFSASSTSSSASTSSSIDISPATEPPAPRALSTNTPPVTLLTMKRSARKASPNDVTPASISKQTALRSSSSGVLPPPASSTSKKCARKSSSEVSPHASLLVSRAKRSPVGLNRTPTSTTRLEWFLLFNERRMFYFIFHVFIMKKSERLLLYVLIHSVFSCLLKEYSP
jgi:hypothetical protein